MYLPDFDYYVPADVREASAMLARLNGDASVLAGGTDLLPYMKNEVMAPRALVSLKELNELREITYKPGTGVAIGARVTHNGLVRSPELRQRYLSISETAHAMASYQIRNRGTIGGNIVSAVPSADLPPILIALKASVTLESSRGTRTISLENFFTGPRRSVIARDEILTQITIPDEATTGSVYMKFGLRRSGALAVVGAAVSLVATGTRVEQVRIVLGAVAPTPMRALEAERLLTGASVTEALLREAGMVAANECSPISDIRGSQEYRREMVAVFTRRAIRKALEQTAVVKNA